MFYCHGKEVETTEGLKFLHHDDPLQFFTHQINISTTNRSRISLTRHVESMGNRKFHKPVGSEEMKVTCHLEVLEAHARIILGLKCI